jgi:shikimate dehydrogenase
MPMFFKEGLPIHYAVAGDPIEHSLSPAIFSCLFGHYGIRASYGRIRLAREDTEKLRGLLLGRNLSGVNLTMPHKQAIIPYLDEIEPFARLCASVNTVVVQNGRLTGYSTDAQGFYASLDESGFAYKGQDLLFLGAGGAARTLAMAGASLGARSVTIAARTKEHAQEIAELIRKHFNVETAASGFSAGELSALTARCGLCVNTTPLGMSGVDGEFQDLSFLDGLQAGTPVCDLIYRPEKTAFLRYAEASGHPVLNGLGMLIFQAFAAFKLFTGIEPDPRLSQAVRQALHQSGEEASGQ